MSTALAARNPISEPAAPDGRPPALVIGSGFGGLAAAIRLAARGYRVTVLERLEAPGGRAVVHRQDGFTFDAGPTIITAPFLFEELWALAGARFADEVDLRPLSLFYRIRFDDGVTLDSLADDAAMRREVARIAPGDLAGYDRFLAHSARIYRLGFEQLAHRPFGTLSGMLALVPDLLRLGGLRSVHALASRYVRDERLRFLLSFHPLFVGGSPFATPGLYALISHLERAGGVHAAIGGTGAIIAGMVRLLQRLGGTLRLSAEVDEILTWDGRVAGVRLATGESLAAPLVVSNAEIAHTYGRLLRNAPRRTWSDRRLRRLRHSMSLFVWYFGTSRRYPQVPHHTILLGPRYKGLVDDIFRRRVLAPDFSLYLHRPTATDPTLAPPGCDTFYVLSPVPNLDAAVDWRAAAEPYRRAIERRLAETLLPGLGPDILTARVMTPMDFADRLLSTKGAAFGPEPILTQSAWFRPHNRSEDVEGLYLVGAGTHPGPGIPGVLSSARVLDALVPATPLHAAAARLGG